jgi:hypothetical protein
MERMVVTTQAHLGTVCPQNTLEGAQELLRVPQCQSGAVRWKSQPWPSRQPDRRVPLISVPQHFASSWNIVRFAAEP